jgi:hypothetical protein
LRVRLVIRDLVKNFSKVLDILNILNIFDVLNYINIKANFLDVAIKTIVAINFLILISIFVSVIVDAIVVINFLILTFILSFFLLIDSKAVVSKHLIRLNK